MALALTFSRDKHGAWAIASGRLTGDEVLAAIKAVNARHAATPVLYTFFDFDAVTEIDLVTEKLRQAANAAIDASRAKSAPRVVAICATSDL